MICATCNADVHPQPHRVSVGYCVRCHSEVPGFKAHDDRYACPACGNVDRVAASSKWIHRCPAANCGARMPSPDEVVDEAPAILLPEEQAVLDEQPAPPPRPVRSVAKVASRNQPVDVIAQVRERLAFVQERIAELRAFEKEEMRLTRMLAVVDADDLAAE